MKGRPRRSTLFPYPTVFRSHVAAGPESPGSGGTRARGPSPQGSLHGHADEWEPRLQENLEATVREHAFRQIDRKSTRLNSSHSQISYAVFCLKTTSRSRTTP